MAAPRRRVGARSRSRPGKPVRVHLPQDGGPIRWEMMAGRGVRRADRAARQRAASPRGGAVLQEFETHEVFNQPPPLEGHNVFTADRVLCEAVAREGAPWATGDLEALGALAGQPATIELGRLANVNRPELRTFDRFGHRIDVVDYHPAYHELMSVAIGTRPARRAVVGSAPRGPCGARRQGRRLVPGRVRPRLPGVDDLLGGAGAPARAGLSQPTMGAGHHLDDLRPGRRTGSGQGRGHLRHGPHREAGRLGRPRQHDEGGPRPCRARRLPPHRPQVVLLGSDVRRLPHAGPGAGRAELLLGPPVVPGRVAEPDPDPATQGQAGRPVERVERDRAGRGLGPPGRRGGPRRPHHHRDGPAHPAGLRARGDGGDAPGPGPGHAGTPPTARRSAGPSSTSP